MERRRETGADSSVPAFARTIIAMGLPALLVLTSPFALLGSTLANKIFFWTAGCSVFVVLVILAARWVDSKVQFVGAFVLLAGLAMLFMFVPPFEREYLSSLANGAYAGCLLGLIPAFGRIERLTER